MSRTEYTSRWEQYGAISPRAADGWAFDTLVLPNPLYGSNGIRFAPDGRLWITQVNGDQITAWDPADGALRIADPMGSPMEGPDDLAFDSAGTCFVTETMNNRVSSRAGDDYKVLLGETVGPNGITIDPATDRLFVDEMSEGGRVLELDRSRPGAARVIAAGLDWLNGMERGPDGRLFLPQVFAGTIIAVDPDAGAVATVVTDLTLPVAAKFASDGRLVVADAGAGEIVAIDLTDGSRRTLCSPGPSIDNLCFDSGGALYTSNFVEARVERWDPLTGERTATIAPGGLIGPGSIGVWDDDSFIVSDHNSIIRVGNDGRLDRQTRLLGGQQFVANAAVRVNGEVYALTLAGEILAIDPATSATRNVVTTAGSLSEQILGLSSGGATALAASRSALYAALGGDIVDLAPDGRHRERFTTGLERIDAIAVTPAGDRLVACDKAAGIVAVWRDGTLCHHGGFDHPEALALLGDVIAVAEVGTRRILAVGSDGRQQPIAEQLPIGMPRRSDRRGRTASMLSTDPETLFIGCDGDGSVLRLRRR